MNRTTNNKGVKPSKKKVNRPNNKESKPIRQAKLDLDALADDKDASGYLLSMFTALYACVYSDSVKPLEFFLKKRSEGSWKATLTKKAVLLGLSVIIQLLSKKAGIKSKSIKKIGLSDRIRKAMRKALGVKEVLKSGLDLDFNQKSKHNEETNVMIQAFESDAKLTVEQSKEWIDEINVYRTLNNDLRVPLDEVEYYIKPTIEKVDSLDSHIFAMEVFERQTDTFTGEPVGLFDKNQLRDFHYHYWNNEHVLDTLESEDVNPFEYYMVFASISGLSINPDYRKIPGSTTSVSEMKHDAVPNG